MEDNSNKITDIQDIMSLLIPSQITPRHNYSARFQFFRRQAETQHLRFKSNNNESYNNPFSIEEITNTISKAHDTTVGLDDIHYQMLKHLPKEALQTLLEALNEIWYSGNFPDSWRTSTVIPVPKPGKDKSDSSNYRPIALTSCICKIMERMIKNRLVWYLEQNYFITPVQRGFCKQLSRTDHLVRLESFVWEAFVQRQYAVAIFFDLEKAYERTWKYGIMKDLHNEGLHGRLPCFIEGFLRNRNFCVRLGSCLSDLHE